MAKRIILGALLTDRFKEALAFQEVLTKFGCNIKTRIGLHNVTENACSNSGLILLEMFGDEKQINQLEDTLRQIDGIVVQKMVFEEPDGAVHCHS
ncbi:MAG: hypothetical protein QHH26_06555 [Armatimonadota bacterium]|nr:hypothetical protein [Armatimonadota bacterium]